jgi:hypothetical protein
MEPIMTFMHNLHSLPHFSYLRGSSFLMTSFIETWRY